RVRDAWVVGPAPLISPEVVPRLLPPALDSGGFGARDRGSEVDACGRASGDLEDGGLGALGLEPGGLGAGGLEADGFASGGASFRRPELASRFSMSGSSARTLAFRAGMMRLFAVHVDIPAQTMAFSAATATYTSTGAAPPNGTRSSRGSVTSA